MAVLGGGRKRRNDSIVVNSSPLTRIHSETLLPLCFQAWHSPLRSPGGRNDGPCPLYYERFSTPEISARGGVMVFSVSETENGTETSATVNVIPLTANYFLENSHRLELGAGPMLIRLSAEVGAPRISDSDSGVSILGTATVGYRYQSPGGGFLFRIGLTPVIADGIGPWVGLSVGWAF